MDPSRPVVYRSVNINNATLETGRVLRGITVENIDYSNISAVGYVEKRAAADGIHASDVYNGARQVDLNGLVYASSVAEMFDYLHILRSVFSPTSQYQESPGDRGFLPLTFHEPTLDTDSFPGGVKDLVMNLRSQNNLRFAIARDRIIVKNGGRPAAIGWTVQLFAKDPRVYVNPYQVVDISGGPWTNKAGTAVNRGDYETPLNMILIRATAPGAGKTVRVQGFGVDMTITLLNEANRIYRWYGDDRVLMVQDSSAGPTAVQTLRMDLVSFATKNRRPMVPALINPPTRPFTSPFTYTTGVALDSGSQFFWNEAFA